MPSPPKDPHSVKSVHPHLFSVISTRFSSFPILSRTSPSPFPRSCCRDKCGVKRLQLRTVGLPCSLPAALRLAASTLQLHPRSLLGTYAFPLLDFPHSCCPISLVVHHVGLLADAEYRKASDHARCQWGAQTKPQWDPLQFPMTSSRL
ncbi:hypothetical protein L1887_48022 [Cichorium endivia]|nr:hypothetical protein L1887_48022 [Cichorium endivia]